MTHPALTADSVALVTGGASGIGRAAAHRFAAMGMAVVVVDTIAERLGPVAEELLSLGARDVMTSVTDVADRDALDALSIDVTDRLGGVDILMNNAGIQPGSALFSDEDTWRRVVDVNLWGIVNGTRAFAPSMMSNGRPGAIINTGSKQGITTPPGDPVYNMAKAGVKAFTEALAHELRADSSAITAHLLIPGFVFTELNARGRTEKPDGAWTPEQCVDFMIDSLSRGDFYILCPDGDVSRDLDEKRMAWAMGDIIENRPALSRWHPDYAEAFDTFVKG